MKTLFQRRQERQTQARAATVARLVRSAEVLLRRADADGRRDLSAYEARQAKALLNRADRLLLG